MKLAASNPCLGGLGSFIWSFHMKEDVSPILQSEACASIPGHFVDTSQVDLVMADVGLTDL